MTSIGGPRRWVKSTCVCSRSGSRALGGGRVHGAPGVGSPSGCGAGRAVADYRRRSRTSTPWTSSRRRTRITESPRGLAAGRIASSRSRSPDRPRKGASSKPRQGPPDGSCRSSHLSLPSVTATLRGGFGGRTHRPSPLRHRALSPGSSGHAPTSASRRRTRSIISICSRISRPARRHGSARFSATIWAAPRRSVLDGRALRRHPRGGRGKLLRPPGPGATA